MHLIVYIGDNTGSVADINLSVECFAYSVFFIYSKGFIQNIPQCTNDRVASFCFVSFFQWFSSICVHLQSAILFRLWLWLSDSSVFKRLFL